MRNIIRALIVSAVALAGLSATPTPAQATPCSTTANSGSYQQVWTQDFTYEVSNGGAVYDATVSAILNYKTSGSGSSLCVKAKNINYFVDWGLNPPIEITSGAFDFRGYADTTGPQGNSDAFPALAIPTPFQSPLSGEWTSRTASQVFRYQVWLTNGASTTWSASLISDGYPWVGTFGVVDFLTSTGSPDRRYRPANDLL